MAGPSDDQEMEKMAEEELSKLHRQFRVMELDRAAVDRSARAPRRLHATLLHALTAQLDDLMLRLRLTRSATRLLHDAAARSRLLALLDRHRHYAAQLGDHRANVAQLEFLLKQVQKEIEALQAKGAGEGVSADGGVLVGQLENRLDTAMTKLNAVNGDNYTVRLAIDRLLRERQRFNGVWRARLQRLADGRAHVLELLEQALATYDQRDDWCAKLAALRDRAAVDCRKHCLELRELQRQLDHGLKLERFLRTKGTVRLTAADARAEAKRLERQEREAQEYGARAGILDALREYTGEPDVERSMQEFTRREEENYALFNYINEVNSELQSLGDTVRALRTNIADERARQRAGAGERRDSADALRAGLEARRFETRRLDEARARSRSALETLLAQVGRLAEKARCDSLPLLRLLGQALDVNEANARLYLKSFEKKVLETAEALRAEERLQEPKDRTPPASRRRRRAPEPSPRPR